MFRLHKQKSDKLGDRFDFKFSDLHALQVPKGWDKLVVSVTCMESGKVTVKSSKAPVWNGNCQWTETLAGSVLLASYEAAKEIESCLFKVIVSMGSSRSAILGEATVNLVSYVNTETSVPVSLPLKKCSHGTILQMKIQCSNPRAKTRDKTQDINSSLEEVNVIDYDTENKSEVSDNLSNVSEYLSDHPEEAISRETSFSASGSHYSFNSEVEEGSFGRDKFSPQRNLSEINSPVRRQDSASSHNSIGYGSPSRSNTSNSKAARARTRLQNEELYRVSKSLSSPLQSSGSSNELLEAVEVTVEEARAEARKWERNSRKLMVDIENLQKELSNESEEKEALRLELSASKAKCDDLSLQIEEVKIVLEESVAKDKGMDSFQKELEEEVEFLKESNANLALQLKKTQESNIELVSVLQEMEETMENQKVETANISSEKPVVDIVGEGIKSEIRGDRDYLSEIKSLKNKVQELERDCNELTDENLQLVFRVKELENHHVWNGSSKEETEICQISELQEDLKSKDILYEEISRNHRIRELEVAALEEQLEHYRNQSQPSVSDNGKCNCSSDDLEMMKGTYFITHNDQYEAIMRKLTDMRKLVECGTEDTKDRKYAKGDDREILEENAVLSIDEELGCLQILVESRLKDLHKELTESISEVDKVKSDIISYEEEIEALRNEKRELGTRINNINDEKYHLQEKVHSMESEGDVKSKCLEGLQNDLMALRSKEDAEVSSKEVLLRKSLELECDKNELELQLYEVEEENLRLSERICGLEAQLRYLTDQRETSRLMLQNSESQCSKLQENMSNLQQEREEQKRKFDEMQKQLLEAKEESGFLRFSNQKIQATADTIIEECSLLQKSNAELRRQKIEIHEHCNLFEAEVKESRKAFENLSTEVEVLREKFTSLCEETSLKERAINAELDALILETVIRSTQNVQEFDREFQLAETDVKGIDEKSKARMKEIMEELAESKQNQEILMAEREKLLNLLENYKSNESKIKASIRSLEMKLKASEYEKKQLVDDISSMKDQLQRSGDLQNEVLALKRNLDEAKFENERLEASLLVIKGHYEEMKAERASLAEKISTMQSELLELEGCRNRNVALEERVLRLEGDLTAREAMHSEEAELKNELARFRRTNNQLQRRVHEQEQRAQALEEELKKNNRAVEDQSKSSNGSEDPGSCLLSTLADNRSRDTEKPLLKIELLKNKLEANETYKEQFKSSMSKGAERSAGEARLENELRELRESYFRMSLKYAQVETEREELVMKLKGR